MGEGGGYITIIHDIYYTYVTHHTNVSEWYSLTTGKWDVTREKAFSVDLWKVMKLIPRTTLSSKSAAKLVIFRFQTAYAD